MKPKVVKKLLFAGLAIVILGVVAYLGLRYYQASADTNGLAPLFTAAHCEVSTGAKVLATSGSTQTYYGQDSMQIQGPWSSTNGRMNWYLGKDSTGPNGTAIVRFAIDYRELKVNETNGDLYSLKVYRGPKAKVLTYTYNYGTRTFGLSGRDNLLGSGYRFGVQESKITKVEFIKTRASEDTTIASCATTTNLSVTPTPTPYVTMTSYPSPVASQNSNYVCGLTDELITEAPVSTAEQGVFRDVAASYIIQTIQGKKFRLIISGKKVVSTDKIEWKVALGNLNSFTYTEELGEMRIVFKPSNQYVSFVYGNPSLITGQYWIDKKQFITPAGTTSYQLQLVNGHQDHLVGCVNNPVGLTNIQNYGN